MHHTKSIIANKDIVPKGFTVKPHRNNKRLQHITLEDSVIAEFEKQVEEINVQSLEYKPFLRFKIADILNSLCNHTLGSLLLGVLKDRHSGAFLLSADNFPTINILDFNIKISTAVSHLIGKPYEEAEFGKYYSRFTIINEDETLSFSRHAHRRSELHNDATYVNDRTDYVLLQKMVEENMQGGNSLILHIDDWKDLDKFYHHPMAKKNVLWTSPPSRKVNYSVTRPVFFEEDEYGRPHMLYSDQFAQPENMVQGLYLYEMGKSIESEHCTNLSVPVSNMLVLANHFWLHGREKFIEHKDLKREMLRQRGHFTR